MMLTGEANGYRGTEIRNEEIWPGAGAARRGSGHRTWRDSGAARTERGGEDHGREDPPGAYRSHIRPRRRFRTPPGQHAGPRSPRRDAADRESPRNRESAG